MLCHANVRIFSGTVEAYNIEDGGYIQMYQAGLQYSELSNDTHLGSGGSHGYPLVNVYITMVTMENHHV